MQENQKEIYYFLSLKSSQKSISIENRFLRSQLKKVIYLSF